MKTILDFLSYEGGEVSPSFIYNLKNPITISGRAEFQTFGKVTLNGIDISNLKMNVNLAREATFKGSGAVMFLNTGVKAITKQLQISPVPDVPSREQDEMQRFIEMARHAGFVHKSELAEGESEAETETNNDYEEFAIEEDDEFEEDTYGLIEEQENTGTTVIPFDDKVPEISESESTGKDQGDISGETDSEEAEIANDLDDETRHTAGESMS